MIDGQDRGGHEPGKAEQRADDDKYCNYEQIQVVAATFLQRKNASKPIISKVHTFGEGHQILRNLHRRFDHYYIEQIYCGDFSKICGLLRIYEL